MGIYNYHSIISKHLEQLDETKFIETASRLASHTNSNSEIQFDPKLLLKGYSFDGTLHIIIPNSSKSLNDIKAIFPQKSKPNIITIYTNHSALINPAGKKKLESVFPKSVLNILTPEKLCDIISELPPTDIKYILGENTIISNYIHNSLQNEKNRNIIKTILDYLFDTSSEALTSSSTNTVKKLTPISEKIKINVGKPQHKPAENLYKEHLNNILLVQQFITNQAAIDNRPINALISLIRRLYCQLKDVDFPETIILDISIFEDLAVALVPQNHKDSPEYIYNTKSIILFFFEFCFIGAKTKEDDQLDFYERLNNDSSK